MERDLALEKTTPHSSQVQCLQHLENIKAILDSLDVLSPDSSGFTSSPHFEPPPSYTESIADEPPSYDCTDDLVLAQAARYYPIPPPAYFYKHASSILPPDQMTTPDIDFGDTSNFRQTGNKKKDKQQKKQADAAKWNDDGGEGNAEGGEGGEENGGGEGGGGNNGDGGAGDDGGGGDDWSGWDAGKKKKGKKAKEEEKKKQEEEEEKKRKEEEEANGDGKLDWADDANGDAGDDWGGFTTTTTKKGKKDKKGKIEPAAQGTNDFADINLDDSVPKLDLSFGPTETKESGGFSWGGGASAWNAGSSWTFGGADIATTDIADSFSRATKDSTTDTTDGNAWSFGGNKKNQKKTTTSGFDFGNFGALDEEDEDEQAEEDKVGGNDNWGTFTAAGKRDKKSKKKGTFDDISNDPDPNTIGTALAEPEPAAEDSWNTWGTSSTKKKKGKKGEDEVPPVQPPAAAVHAPVEPAVDEWGGFGTKKGGKKGKKITEVNEPAVAVVPEPEPEVDAGWGTFGKKEKKKGKKELEKLEEPAVTIVPEPEPEADAAWASFGKKEEKKGKKGKKEPDKVEEPTTTTLEEPEPDFGFGAWGKKEEMKGKKGKKEPDKVEEPTITTLEEPEPDFGFGAWGKKEGKKGKKGKKELEISEEPTMTALPGAEPNMDFGLGSHGKKNDKKGKKGKKDDEVDEPADTEVLEPEPEADIGWGTFAKKEVKKKGKKDIDKTEEPWAKEPDPELVDDWGSFNTKNDNDKKKGKKSNLWDGSEKDENHFAEETPEPEVEVGKGAFVSKKDKRKGKKDAVEEIEPIEPEPVVDEKPNLSRIGSTKGKKGKKGLISEVKDDPMPAIESKAATDAASVAADDDWASGFGGDKKKEKKTKRNSLASTGSKGDEVPPPPPPVPDVPDASTFDTWGTAKKEKDKDKRGKKGKVTEPEYMPMPEPEETKDTVEDDMASWAGLSAKERKKKEKEREKKEREAKEAKEKEEAEEKERIEKEEAEEREREEKEQKEKEKPKGKIGKKGKANTSPETSKTKDLLADSVPDFMSVEEENTWGSSWGAGASKKEKKKVGKNQFSFDAPPPAPTPPAQGLTPEPEQDFGEDLLDDNWNDFPAAKTTATKGKKDGKKDAKEGLKGKKGMKGPMEDVVDDTFKESLKEEVKKKDASKEDTPAKAAKSFWGGMATTSASKPKTSAKDKDKAAQEAEEEAEQEEEEVMMMEDEANEDSNKYFAKNGLWKTSSKDSDKASKGSSVAKKKGITDTDDVADPVTSKGKKGKFQGGADRKDKDDEGQFVDSVDIWGSSLKKTTGNLKKADELSGTTKEKEIAAKEMTNQKLTGKKGISISNEPEPTHEDDQPSASQPSKPFKSAMSMSMSTAKSTKNSSVLQRVKEIENEKNDKNKASHAAPPAPEPEPSLKFNGKAVGSGKGNDLATSKTAASKAKHPSPASKINKKASKEEAVPGSFPGEGMDDDFNNLDDFLDDEPPLEKKESKKTAKSTKDSKLTSQPRDTPESKRPPTPPPEPKEEKPAKKERPRIAKEGGASSWGLWGPAPPKKKAMKSKDDADVASPPKKEKAAAPGFTRSKSTRTAKEKDKETVKSDTKSDESEKPKKTESRPPKSRGSSFGGLFGPPTRSKSVRKNSTATSGLKSAASRRQSMDVDATGLPSPPAEEAPEMTSKAAKMMGTAKLDRKASTRGKQKAPAAPDPYAIDSDDMIMVNDLDDPPVNDRKPSATKDKGSNSKSKGMNPDPGPSLRRDLPDRTKSMRDSKMEPSTSGRKSKIANDFDDDVVMVDAGSSGDANVEPGPDDMQFITKPKGLQRSATSSKKPDSKSGGLGSGLFGAFRKNRRASEVNQLPKTRAIVEDEEVAPRKRTVTGGDDSAKRPRRDIRRKSEKTDRAAEGFVYDTARDVGGVAEADDADARREKRRAKRAEDDRIAKEQREEALKYEADRRAKRRDADKGKLKDDSERRARKDEEAEARRSEDKEARRTAREARRREEEANRALEDDILKPRSKRRDTDKEVPAASSSRLRASDRRRSHVDKAPERPKSSRRKSTMAPVDDYFDSRNARPLNENDPYGGNDHTASWVKSQVSEPPEPPPVEPTIMEQAPDFRAKGADDLMEDEYARRASHKKPKRSSRMYTDPLADEQEERSRRRKEKEVRSSEGSAAEERYGGLGSMNRRQSDLGGVKLGAGTKTFDGKTGQGKRSSWFQKVTGGF